MAKSWSCEICEDAGTELGAYVKLSGTKYTHLRCYRDMLMAAAVEKYLEDEREKAADLRRAEEDRAKAKEEAEQASLLTLRAKGKDLWTRSDRMKLAEAKMICVHCGVPIGPQAEPRSGPEQKHCRKCYFAREYGEKQASAAAAKSQASLDAASAVLAGSKPVDTPAQPAQPEKKPEEKAKADRFNLIEIE